MHHYVWFLQIQSTIQALLPSIKVPDPKKGLVKLCTKCFQNFDWMTFTNYISDMSTLVKADPLEVIALDGSTLFFTALPNRSINALKCPAVPAKVYSNKCCSLRIT